MTDATTDLGLVAIPARKSRGWIGILLTLVLVLGAAGSSLFLVRSVDSQLTDIANTYEVRRQARELILALVDAETGQRGFLLTQDVAYLEPYRRATASIDATYQTLLELVENSPGQGLRITAMNEPIQRRLSELSRTIELASSSRLNEALALVRSDIGREFMDGVREQVRSFIADEDAKLIERNNAVQSYRQMLVGAILAALAGSAILAYLLFTRSQQQVTSLARTSTELLAQNEELEEHVRARTSEAEEARAHAERERARVEALLQDTNHRIGNSLATVSSLLGLQVTRTKSEEVRMALEAAQGRVHAIASAHRRLRLGDDLETTNADEFLASVIEDLESTHATGRNVTFHGEFDPLVINARDATTIGIVFGELITNALKHAFPDDRHGKIWAKLKRNDEGVLTLSVEDDGKGLPEDAAKTESGLGALIIRQLARQFGGEPHYERRAEGGTRVTVTLPKLEHPETLVS
jgi:two-component sensor histidine kinase/CHASE3 domain sensor protein